MAHVQIPAKEDVAQFPFHHAGIVKAPSLSLTGEGCEVEQLNSHAFRIKVSQQAEKSLEAITDFGPLWDAIHDLEERVKLMGTISEARTLESESHVRFLKERLEERIERIAGHVSLVEAKTNVNTANLLLARDLARYALCGAALSTTLSLITGIALWILRV